MKNLFATFFIIAFHTIINAQKIDFSGYINQNTNWNYDTVCITGDVTVINGVTLNIQPNSVILFQNYYKLKIQGTLLAEGLENEKIKFTVADTTGHSDTTHYAGSWNSIEFDNITANNDSSKLSYCILEYGKARGETHDDKSGGALFIDNCSKIKISNCQISENIALYNGAGIFLKNNSSPIIKNCLINKNRSYKDGGGISAGEGCNPLIIGNTIKYNVAYSEINTGGYTFISGSGGAIHLSTVYGTGASVINNLICNNKSFNGTIYDSSKGCLISGNIICNNNASGIYNGHQLSKSLYVNNTVCNNYIENQSYGIYSHASNIKIENNIIWNNTNNLNQEIDGNNIPNVNHNNIKTGYLFGTNITEEPLFIAPTEGQGIDYDGSRANWNLADNSPCVNAGNIDTSGLLLPEFDFLENQRIYGDRIDIGALENQNIITNIYYTETSNEIKIFPNPCSNFININTNEEITNIKIFDFTGKLILTQNILNLNDVSLNFSNLCQGIYMLRIKTKDSEHIRKIYKL